MHSWPNAAVFLAVSVSCTFTSMVTMLIGNQSFIRCTFAFAPSLLMAFSLPAAAAGLGAAAADGAAMGSLGAGTAPLFTSIILRSRSSLSRCRQQSMSRVTLLRAWK